ncbi:hypothetical protein FA95DRAFT_1677942 [Auriscalpium vulgare]|uniref:Uncharacterized protein n=1 Tax=Auriscalpium vulgare TaxID=40419 RepID=A0ACB8RZM1_9AGAM|nr:hypothetical protein FA95DRAFT_1677942 [Auriscalpium vulgare]
MLPEDDYPDTGIATVLHLSRNSDRAAIDVVIAYTNSPTLPIRHFWTTLLANFISADAICVTYPKLTLNGRGCINPDRLADNNMSHVRAKYIDRGFQIGSWEENGAVHVNGISPHMYCPHQIRHFNDSACLFINFDPMNSNQLLHIFPIYEPYWKYGGWECGGRCRIPDPCANTNLLPYIV